MCPPPCGRRRARLGGTRKLRKFPESWLNAKRKVVGDAVLSLDGSTLVKVNPNVSGEYIVPTSTTKILAEAFRKCELDEVIIHSNVTSTIRPSMFRGSHIRRIQLPTGESIGYCNWSCEFVP